MNRYQPSTFRPAFGVAAASLSAVTLAISVVLPMSFSPSCPTGAGLASTSAEREISIMPAHFDAVATSVRTVTLEPINIVASRVSQST